jgi:8-oxo-dGTP diphosphatase
MEVYLVRHAKAGSRSRYDGDDRQRPLSDKGRAQADALAARLATAGVTALLSSPYIRCVQTLEPLAASVGLPVEPTPSLAEGAGPDAALALVESADAPLALCSHGDVIGDLVSRLVRRGVTVCGDGLEKGSVWVLTVEAGTVTSARYDPPPT